MLTTDTGGKSLSVSLTTPNINHHPIIRKQPISYLNKVFTGLLRPYLNTILHIEYLKSSCAMADTTCPSGARLYGLFGPTSPVKLVWSGRGHQPKRACFYTLFGQTSPSRLVAG